MKLFKWGLAVLVVFIAASVALNAWLVHRTAANLAARRAEIRASGAPVYLTDIPQPAIAPKENAIFYLRGAMSDLAALNGKLVKQFPTPSGIWGVEVPLTAAECEHLASLFAEYPELFARLEQAAACSQYDAGLDYSQGIFLTLNHIQPYRDAMWMLALRARLRIGTGQTDEAIRDTQRILHLAQLLQNEPILISYLASAGGIGFGVQTGNEALRSGPVSEDLRQSLDAQLAGLDSLEPLKKTMQGERAWGLQTYDQVRSGKISLSALGGGPPSGGAGNWLVTSWIGQAYMNDDESTYVDLLSQTVDNVDKPLREFEDQQEQIEEELKSLGYRAAVTRMMLPALGKTREYAERMRAQVRALRVLNALTRLTQADPAAKPKLEQLGLPAAATTDPFNDQPLKLLRGADGWVIYSVGPDLKDDGGDASDGQWGIPDVVLEPPARAAAREQAAEQAEESFMAWPGEFPSSP